MGEGIYVALGGAVAQATALDITAQNLANASTAGFQRLQPVFHEALRSARAPQMRSSELARTALDVSPQAMRMTGGALDAALPDRRYFALQTPAGAAFTRAGHFQVAADGTLQTAAGDVVLDEQKQPIRIPDRTQSVTLGKSGEVIAAGVQVARLGIVSFNEPSALTHVGNGRLVASSGSGEATAAQSTLTVGALSDSGANVVTGMNDLITASRTFESFQRALETFRDADKAANRINAQ